MSSEHTQDEPRQRRSRRSPLILAAVAVAVLAAGGGGAYWAIDGVLAAVAARARSGRRAAAARPGQRARAAARQPAAPAERIAPGEPDPQRRGLPASGKLPDGPGEAAVYRPRGTVERGRGDPAGAGARGRRARRGSKAAPGRPGATKDGSGPCSDGQSEGAGHLDVRAVRQRRHGQLPQGQDVSDAQHGSGPGRHGGAAAPGERAGGEGGRGSGAQGAGPGRRQAGRRAGPGRRPGW